MTEAIKTKAQLLAEMERDWKALQRALGKLTDAQMTRRLDAAGWNVKDHLVHLMAWERSVVFLLQGKPRHEGLAVSEEVYQNCRITN